MQYVFLWASGRQTQWPPRAAHTLATPLPSRQPGLRHLRVWFCIITTLCWCSLMYLRVPCYCCCNLSGGVALIVWFTTNGMCVKNNTIIYVARASNSKRDCEHDLYCCLPRCEALRTCRSGFPIATLPYMLISLLRCEWVWGRHNIQPRDYLRALKTFD